MNQQEASSLRVLALVVTHNDPASLAECVASIRTQTRLPDDLIVVDNASSPPATLGEPGSLGRVHRNATNLGPAGGYATGIDLFLQSGYELAWVMDDDCTPESRCLELLLAPQEGFAPPTLVLPTVKDAMGTVTNYPGWSGILLPREIVLAVGLPRSDFFWWVEDTEYLRWRIPLAGFDVGRVAEAVVLHGGRGRGTTRPSWKTYYETRNVVFFRVHLHRGGWRTVYKIASVLARTLARILLREDHKLAKFGLFLRGIHDGLFGRLGIRVAVK